MLLEETLKASEGIHQILFNKVPQPLWVYDVETLSFLAVNDAAIAAYGYSREEFLSMTIKEIRPEADTPNLLELLSRNDTQGRQTIWRHKTKDGTIIDVEIQSNSIEFGGRSGRLVLSSIITERLRTEEELRFQKSLLEAQSETSLDGILVVSKEGRILSYNRRFVEIWTIPQHLLNTHSHEIIIGAAAEKVSDPKAFLTKAKYLYEHPDETSCDEIQLKDGKILDRYSAPINKAAGVNYGRVWFFRDISERKNAEDDLRRQKEMLQKMFDHLPLMIGSLDTDGRLLLANREWERLSGWTVEEFQKERMGKSLESCIDLPESQRARDNIPAGTDEWSDFKMRLRDGRIIDSTWATVQLSDGTSVFIGKDITERKRANQQLQELTAALENAVEGIARLDTEGRYTYVNQAYASIVGYTPKEMIGMQWQPTVHADDQPKVAGLYRQMLQTGKVEGDARGLRKDGSVFHKQLVMISAFNEGREFAGHYCLMKDITERKREEAEMAQLLIQVQDQKQRIDNIVATVPGIVWEAWGDPDKQEQRIGFVSSYVEQMLGYRVEEWLSTPNFWLSIVHPDDKEVAGRDAAALYNSGKGGVHSMRWLTRDGRALWVESHIVVMHDASGKPVGLRAVTLDITERRRAEEALRQSEERFRRYFELGLIGMAITSPSKGFIEANDKICAILGYDRTELLQKEWSELTHPDDLAADVANFSRVLAREIDGYSMEKRFIRKDGQIIDTNISVKSLLAEDGAVDCLVALVQDITESKRAEQEMFRLIAAVEQAADSIVITDTEGTIQYVNPAFERITGYSEAEVIGQTPRVLRSGKMGKKLYEELWATIKQGKVWSGHLINRTKEGLLFQEQATISPVRDSSGEIINYVAVKQDITERVQLEDQFLQSQKMEAVGKLAGGVAHDFNNLLTAITGYSDLTMRKLQAEDPLRRNLEEIKKAGDRAAGLTRQLLAFSRKQVLQPKVLNLNMIVSELSKMLQRLIGEDIQLETSVEKALGRVKADPGQIEQVIMNLAVNSRDAMPTGGRLVIETKNVYLDAEYAARHVAISPGSYVMLAVSDTGCGMDEKTKQRVFEPFFTTKETGKGTGLGLSTVYGIIKQSGGNIWVYSELGKGTTFKVYLPRIDEAADEHPLRAKGSGMLQGTETVLLVEDEEMVRKLARQILETCGYKVLEAPHGGAALLLCERHDGPIHLMLTDVVMPEMSGRELMQRLSPLRPEMRVLFMSGYTEHAVVYHGVLEAETHFLQKPFTPDTLARKVREVLESKPAAEVSPEVK